MSTIKVGDTVVAIRSAGNEFGKIIKDNEYIVEAIESCSGCGKVYFYVGIVVYVSHNGNSECECGTFQPSAIYNQVSVCSAHFRKIEPAKQKASYRLCALEILTQFPVIRETSDQEIKTTERETV